MYTVCPSCGEHRPDRVVDPATSVAVCPVCGHRQPFVKRPLLVVGGASGSGKSTVCQALLGRVGDVVLLDSDLLWRPEFNTPDTGYADFFETWLRLAVAIHQSTGPVVLFGAGFAVPENLEARVYRRYLARIDYLALVCSDDLLGDRLRARPLWRGAGGNTFIAGQIAFNSWLRAEAPGTMPEYAVVDTDDPDPSQTARRVAAWISTRTGA